MALNCGMAITWGIDNKLKTPYSYTFDLSLQRELPGGFLVEANYVGRLGRHLLEQLDLAEPVNMVDKQGGGDYFTAAAALSKIADANGGNKNATVQSIPYFEHMFPFMADANNSATQNIYTQLWASNRYGGGETNALYSLDLYDNPAGPQFQIFHVAPPLQPRLDRRLQLHLLQVHRHGLGRGALQRVLHGLIRKHNRHPE
jgi:hypothetical protein